MNLSVYFHTSIDFRVSINILANFFILVIFDIITDVGCAGIKILIKCLTFLLLLDIVPLLFLKVFNFAVLLLQCV
jgi:hypothetical protein